MIPTGSSPTRQTQTQLRRTAGPSDQASARTRPMPTPTNRRARERCAIQRHSPSLESAASGTGENSGLSGNHVRYWLAHSGELRRPQSLGGRQVHRAQEHQPTPSNKVRRWLYLSASTLDGCRHPAQEHPRAGLPPSRRKQRRERACCFGQGEGRGPQRDQPGQHGQRRRLRLPRRLAHPLPGQSSAAIADGLCEDSC